MDGDRFILVKRRRTVSQPESRKIMNKSATGSVRFGALAGIVGGAATALSGLVIQAVVQPSSRVSDEMWSYPWSSDALVPVSLLFAIFHLLVFGCLLGFARSGLAGPSGIARVGTTLALVGTALLFAGELASIPINDQRLDDPGPMTVGGIFGLGVLLTAVGLLLAGWATLRAGQRRDWRRFVPLAAGVWTTALIGVSFSKALPTGVGIYGLCILVLGLALYTQPTQALAGTRPPAARAKVVS